MSPHDETEKYYSGLGVMAKFYLFETWWLGIPSFGLACLQGKLHSYILGRGSLKHRISYKLPVFESGWRETVRGASVNKFLS